jgi:hypothetical protein
MRAYLAAAFSRKNEIADKTKELQSIGVEITSTWPWEDAAPNTKLSYKTDDYLREYALRDLGEIEEADTIILFTQDPTIPFCRGGRMHEFGFANGRGKRLIVVGPRENIFHYLPHVEVFATWEDLTKEIRTWMAK